MVNFAGNDYLGLSQHPAVVAAAIAALRGSGVGSGGSALITGYRAEHAALEAAIRRWKHTPAAVLVASGYQANHAAVQTLAALGERAGGVRFLMDRLCHASLIDAVRASGQKFRVFPHNHLPKLRRLLEQTEAGAVQVVITESIFSMDGDAADLAGLAKLKREKGFLLLLDEAHGSGVYGPRGAGYAAEIGLGDLADVCVVTLSKALGCIGGVVCGSAAICRAVVQYGRGFIYSTSMPPAMAAAATAAIGVLAREPERQERVRDLARRLRQILDDLEVRIPPGDSPIVPIILGTASAALEAAAVLRQRGIFVPAIRPPTVGPGSSRLRITLCCEHTDAELHGLIEALIPIIVRSKN